MENPSKVAAPKAAESNQKDIANHKEIAKHLHEAANLHLEAAKHHEANSHDKAVVSAEKANTIVAQATKLQASAAK